MKHRLCIKSPAPGALCAKSVFQMQPPISGVNFSNNILVPHITLTQPLKPFKLLTTNLNEPFHNIIE